MLTQDTIDAMVRMLVDTFEGKKRLILMNDLANLLQAEKLCVHLSAAIKTYSSPYSQVVLADRNSPEDEVPFLRYGRYKNGDPDIEICNLTNLKTDADVAVLITPRYDTVYTTMELLRQLVQQCNGTVHILIMFGSFLTKDRRDTPGEIATGPRMVSELMGILKTGNGKGRMLIVDPHSLQTITTDGGREAIIEAMPTLILAMLEGENVSIDRVAFVFSDGGAAKRYGSAIEKVGGKHCVQLTCNKIRTSEGTTSTLGDGGKSAKMLANKTVFVIDDMVRSGGTLVDAVGHIVLAGVSVEHIAVGVVHYDPVGEPHIRLANAGVRKLYVTDSNSDVVASAALVEMLSVVPIASVVANALMSGL